MKLKVFERLIVNSLLPDKGSYVNRKLIRKASEELSFSDKENKILKFNQNEDGQVTWTPNLENPDEDLIPEKDIDFGDTVTQMIVDKLKEMNDKEELEVVHESLYEKFVLSEDQLGELKKLIKDKDAQMEAEGIDKKKKKGK